MNISEIITWLSNKEWILQIFLIVLACLILHYIEIKIHKRIFSRLQRTRAFWDKIFIYALHKPLGALIWVLGISYVLQIISFHVKEKMIFNFLGTAREFAILIILIWFLIRFISYAEQKIVAKNTKDKTTVHALCQLFRAAVIILAILISLQIFGVPISAVLAFGGMGGLAAGFAAKDTLANFFGGLMIYLDRPFSVGDSIYSPDKKIEGTVEHIGWRLTRIRGFDKRPLFIPNGIFSTISIINSTRMTNRRIKAIINLRYDDASKIAAILTDIEKMLREHPGIDTEQTLTVNLVECASWSLNFMLYAYTKTINWVEFQAVQQDVFLKVLEIVAAHGAECAFPTSTIHIPEPIEVTK